MIHSITAGIAGLETALGLVAELLSITALFTALNFLSNLIRLTYKAGKFTGYIWFTFIVPAILWLADGISYVNSLIDWQFAIDTFIDSLKVVVSATIAAYLVAKPVVTRWLSALRKETSIVLASLVFAVAAFLPSSPRFAALQLQSLRNTPEVPGLAGQ